MANEVQTTGLSQGITSRLSQLRWLIRKYVVLQGVALTVVAISLGFWFSLLIDWTFEPSRGFRIAILVAIGTVAALILLRRIVLRLMVPMSDSNMALLLERKNKDLGDRLLTAVELASRSPHDAGFAGEMLQSTKESAERMIPKIELGQIFSRGPLARAILFALVAVVSIGSFAVFNGEAASLWVQRNVLMGEELWPRATRILVNGFPVGDDGRVVKIAKGTDIEIIAQADLGREWMPPDLLEIHYETHDGAEGRPAMTRRGKALPGRDAYQEYRYQFKDVQSTTRFDVLSVRRGFIGKDARVNGLVIEAVDPPKILELVLSCKFPDYLDRKPGEFPVTGIMTLPEGTEVTVIAQSSKPLTKAEWRLSGKDQEDLSHTIDVDAADASRFRLQLGELKTNTTVLMTLHDLDQVTNQQPIRLRLAATMDQTPRVEVQPAGVGRILTPVARIPIEGEIDDDHYIRRSWFEFRVDQEVPRQEAFELPEDGTIDRLNGPALALSELKLEPGQILSFTVKAEDNYALGQTPHVGASQRVDFKIVTEDELRAQLETKELFLRQRLESVVDELLRVRGSLVRMKIAHKKSKAVAKPEDESKPEETEAKTDTADAGKDSGNDRAASLRALATEEAIQTKSRSESETLQIALEFDQILEELVNNNVQYLDKTKERIQLGISDPLKAVVQDKLPDWGDQLRALREVLNDDAKRPGELAATQAQLGSILQELESVLLNMKELESFNTLIARLRRLNSDHKDVSRLTREHRDKLKAELRKRLLD